jgi:hypothetical protein
MTEGLMSMLLIEVAEEVRRNFVIVMVHVEMARNARRQWIQRLETMGTTHKNVFTSRACVQW